MEGIHRNIRFSEDGLVAFEYFFYNCDTQQQNKYLHYLTIITFEFKLDFSSLKSRYFLQLLKTVILPGTFLEFYVEWARFQYFLLIDHLQTKVLHKWISHNIKTTCLILCTFPLCSQNRTDPLRHGTGSATVLGTHMNTSGVFAVIQIETWQTA